MLLELGPGLELVLGSGWRCMVMAARLFGGMVVEKVQLPQVAGLELIDMCLDGLRG